MADIRCQFANCGDRIDLGNSSGEGIGSWSGGSRQTAWRFYEGSDYVRFSGNLCCAGAADQYSPPEWDKGIRMRGKNGF